MALNKNDLGKINKIFSVYPKIKLAYFFGSAALGEAGHMSDYDFAVWLEETDPRKMFDIKFGLQDKISRLLKTDKIDIVILNLAESPELKFNIVKNGKLIFAKEPFKVLIEPKILNEYFDFHLSLVKNGLTKA
jgi:predicted nucleotidyltransferase